MAHWTCVNFNVPEAGVLADLVGVKSDLLATEKICEKWLAEATKDHPDFELLEIYCAAALTKYGRSLSSGVRAGVPKEIIERLDPHLRDWHKYFKDSRDKWIAHSVNTFEENRVVVWLMPLERGPMEVVDVNVQQHRVAALGVDSILALNALAQDIRAKVEHMEKTERDRLLAHARSLPPEPFYSQEVEGIVPGSEHPGKPRSRK